MQIATPGHDILVLGNMESTTIFTLFCRIGLVLGKGHTKNTLYFHSLCTALRLNLIMNTEMLQPVAALDKL